MTLAIVYCPLHLINQEASWHPRHDTGAIRTQYAIPYVCTRMQLANYHVYIYIYTYMYIHHIHVLHAYCLACMYVAYICMRDIPDIHICIISTYAYFTYKYIYIYILSIYCRLPSCLLHCRGPLSPAWRHVVALHVARGGQQRRFVHIT